MTGEDRSAFDDRVELPVQGPGAEKVDCGQYTVTVREFTVADSDAVAPHTAEVLTALRALYEAVDSPDAVSADQVLGVLQQHRVAWRTLVARACDRGQDWFAALPDRTAFTIELAFWRLNAGFFGRRLTWSGALSQAMNQVMRVQKHNSPTSTSTSSAPDSGATNATSPNDSPGASSAPTPTPSSAADGATAPTS